MIDIITDANQHLYQSELEQIYRFRHWYFADMLGWEDIRTQDGREIDQFDGPDALHLARFHRGRVLSYTRLIPTSRPHLLSDVYPELMDGNSYSTGENIYEWTRFSVDPSCGNLLRLNRATQQIFHGVAEYCVSLEIKHLIVETHPIYITWLTEMGWDVTPISVPKKVDGKRVVVFEAAPTSYTLEVGQRMLGVQGSILTGRQNHNKRQAS